MSPKKNKSKAIDKFTNVGTIQDKNLRSKRILSPENQEDSPQNSSKKPKVYEMSSKEFDALKNLIMSVQSGIVNKIESSQTSLESKINDLSNKVDLDIQSLRSSVDELKKKVSSDIQIINDQLSTHTTR